MSNFGALIYAASMATMPILIWRIPQYAWACTMCMLGLDQLGQSTLPLIQRYPSLTNLVVGICAIIAVLRSWRSALTSIRLGVLVSLLVALLFLYTFVSIIWTPAPEEAWSRWLMSMPYLMLGIVITPLLIHDSKSASTALRSTFFLGAIVITGMLLFANWGTRGLVLRSDYADDQTNPLAIATLGGFLAIVALFMQPQKFSLSLTLFRLFLAVASVAIIVRSESRGQLVALLFSIVVVTSVRYRLTRRDILNILLLAVVVACALGYAFFSFTTADDPRWSSSLAAADAHGRVEMAAALLHRWAASPVSMIFGIGTSASFDNRIIGFYPHITPAEVLGEEGIIGFVLFVTIILFSANRARRRLSATKSNNDEREVFSILLGMLCFAVLQSMKEGSLLFNYEIFMIAIVIARVSESRVVDDHTGTSSSTPSQHLIAFSNLMR